jgi:hypothetical protein
MDLLKISHEIRPQGLHPLISQSGLEINLETQVKEARDDMTEPGVIPLLVDRSVSLGMEKCTKNGNENCTTPMGGTW